MSISQLRYRKVQVCFLAILLATTLQALPMLVSDMSELIDTPAVFAGDPEVDDDGG